MISQIKAWVITVGTFLLFIITLGGYARHQKRRADKAHSDNKQQTEVIKNAMQRQKDNDASRQLSDTDIDDGLHEDYRD